MSSLSDLLASKQPQFQTHQALLVLGLQNEFISPDGGLPVPTESGFLERIKEIVPKFRDLAGDVIWVRSEFESERIVNDGTPDGERVMMDPEEQSNDITALPIPEGVTEDGKPKKSGRLKGKNRKKAMALLKKVSMKNLAQDGAGDPGPSPGKDELFLSGSSNNGHLCKPGSKGADFPDSIKALIDPTMDIMILKSHYSAFRETDLLEQLRRNLITELFICGCLTNLSVYATAVDAAANGMLLNIITDCLGYRTPSRHDAAMKSLIEDMGAFTITSQAILDDLNAPPDPLPNPPAATGLEDRLGKMKLKEASKPKDASSKEDFVTEITNALAAAAIKADTDTKAGDESKRPGSSTAEPTRPMRRGIRTAASQPNLKQAYQKSKIRMRARDDKGKGSDRPTSSRSKEEATPAVPPVPPLPNGHSMTPKPSKEIPRKEDSRPIEKKVESPTKPPHESRAANKEAESTTELKSPKQPPKEEPKQEPIMERSSSTSKSKRKSGQKTLSPMKSSPSLRSTWPSGVIAALRRPSKQQSDDKSDKDHKSEKGSEPSSQAPSRQPSTNMTKSKLKNLSNLPTRGPGDAVGEGDSFIKYDFLPDDIRDPIIDTNPLHTSIFSFLYSEVRWQKMYHAGGEVPRLVAIQGTIDPKDGSKPIYRHPSDQSPPLLPWTHNVDIIRKEAEKIVGHELNHCLIQLYRNGEDYISEHSDKTLDIVRGSSIVNVSFGAQRTMRLRTKKGYHPAPNTPVTESTKVETRKETDDDDLDAASKRDDSTSERITQRIPMPHNSIFTLGLLTNGRWLHGINADKRRAEERSDAEKANNAQRISLTFRQIGTFLSRDETEIWGQGAKGKEKDLASMVVSGDEAETERMIRAFGRENHEWEFDWDGVYGEGFDVLHFRS